MVFITSIFVIKSQLHPEIYSKGGGTKSKDGGNDSKRIILTVGESKTQDG